MHSGTFLLILSLVSAGPVADVPEALESIESTRGGRHWIEDRTNPPQSPEASRAGFEIEPGLQIELFAAEPLVMDPVAIAFDDRGRMFVVEYADYPTGAAEGEPPLSRVVLLEDLDADGRADRRVVFAEGLSFANSLMPYNEGLLVCAQSEILFLRDTDGDDRADTRTVLFSGFQAAHPQMQISNPRWGFDNWIYLNYGTGEVASSQHPEDSVAVPRSEFRFHPLTMEFEPASGLGQFGNTIDNLGNRFFCMNRNPIMTPMLSWREAHRNPFAVIDKTYYDVAPSGGDTRVYPRVVMKSNHLSHAGTHTSACGTTAYLGDLLGQDYTNNVFVCEPIGHLVTRSIIRDDGLELVATRSRPKADFLTSNDTWFRPASLASGPDGALYLADMYRLWVEHPKFLPEEIAKRLDWRAGEDRGRIWKIKANGAPARRFASPKSTSEWVALLGDSNGWCRQLAQRRLVELQCTEATSGLVSLLQEHESAFTRLHALWTLDGLGSLPTDVLIAAMDDPQPDVRCAAVRIAGSKLAQNPSLLSQVAAMADATDSRVRLQVALALGEIDDPEATQALTDLARRDGHDPWFSRAILTSSKNCSGHVLCALVADASYIAEGGNKARIRLLHELATVVGARGDIAELGEVLKAIGASDEHGTWWQTAALSGVATGLPRHQGALGRNDLSALLADPPETLGESSERIVELLRSVQDTAVARDRGIDDRISAIQLLSYQPIDQMLPVYDQLLDVTQPAAVHLAAMQGLNRHGDRAAPIILKHWPGLGPDAGSAALSLLLSRRSSTHQTLLAMLQGTINPAVCDVDQRVRLLRHGDDEIRRLSAELFGEAVSPDRREVYQQYRVALTLPASAQAGTQVFTRVCAKCHKIDGHGHDVGPDISDVRNRSREALLYDILDPNRQLEPRFTDYQVETEDGRVLNGLIVTEAADAVILRQPEGKEQVIPRAEIADLRASARSLMPDGIEKEVSVQQMADLLEYLKSRSR